MNEYFKYVDLFDQSKKLKIIVSANDIENGIDTLLRDSHSLNAYLSIYAF